MKSICIRYCFGVLIGIITIPVVSTAQQVLNPLDLSLNLSGTFGEPRQNHFHSGIDVRTNAREGYAVCSVLDGAVSRVKIGSAGFGTVVYVDHPEGYTSVYAHLHHLEGLLSHYVDSVRMAERKNEIELYPDSTRFQVKAGEVIGISGNTGSSEGPHLHFEWRRKETQVPLNPLVTSLSALIVDSVNPVIRWLKVYAFENEVWLPVHQKKADLSADNKNDTLLVDYDTVGVAINCFDPDSNNRNGVYSLLLRSGNDTLWYFHVDSFRFDDTRYVNAHIDYDHWAFTREQFRRMFRLTGDTVNPGRGSGKIVLNRKGEALGLLALVTDFSGNLDSLPFFLKRSDRNGLSFLPSESTLSGYDTLAGKVRIRIPPSAFYQKTPIDISVRDTLIGASPVPFIRLKSKSLTPLHSAGTLIWYDTLLFSAYPQRLFLGRYDENKRMVEALPLTKVIDGLSASFRHWGDYYFLIDTLAPQITGTGLFLDSADMKLYRFFDIDEAITGIKDYRIELNGNWQLCRYEAKRRKLCIPYHPDSIGPLFYRLELRDGAGNISKAIYTF